MERPTKKLANFVDFHSAELVDNLTSIPIRPLLSHLFRICRHNPELSTKFDHLASDRDLAISLLKLLPKEDLSFYMAFLDALLHSGNFGLFCKFIGLHLVDSSRFEQFARTYDDRPFFAPSNCELPNEEIDFNSTSIDFDHRREFVERHAELLRMKLKNLGELMEMMGKWGGINNFGEEENECQKVINILVDPNQPIHSFESFCLALIVSRQFRIFSIFYELANLEWMEKCWKHFIENGQKEEEQTEEEIEEWMIDENSSQIRVENVDSSFAGGDGTFFDMMAYYRENKNEIYRNFSSPRGLALIINNFHFQNRDKRDGSQVDVVKITNLLQQLNYKVQSKNDLTAEQILWAMSDFATHPEHQRMDSAIVVLMSHGEHDVIMGTDDGKVNVHDLLRSLNQNAPGLRGKPKIFIVQACRGIEMDEGIQRPLRLDEGTDANDGAGGGSSSFWSSLFSSKSKKNANNGRINMSMGGLFRANPPPPSPKQREQHFARKLSIQSVNEPTEVDVLIAYPTTPYYVSWRNSASGSWFVHSLCEVFSKWAKKEDLLSMLTRVNNLVAKRETMCPKRFKQTPEQVNRLRKKFYFFPGVQNFHEGEH